MDDISNKAKDLIINSYFEMFKIDNLGKGILSKLLFLFLFFIRFSLNLLPEKYSDFSAFFIYVEEMRNLIINDYAAFVEQTMAQTTIPLTSENIIYIFLVLLISFVSIIVAFFYTGLFIRDRRIKVNSFIKEVKQNGTIDNRIEIDKNISPIQKMNHMVLKMRKPIKLDDLILRMVILSLVIMVLFVPTLIFVLYLSLLFIIIFPCAIMVFACYLSGDYSFFKSFKAAIQMTKGNYLIIANRFSIIVLTYFICDFITTAIAAKSLAITFVLEPFVVAYLLLCGARCLGVEFCIISERSRRVIRYFDNTNPPE